MKSIVVGTAGHIDHGKSALVRALTGIDPDRLKEEKARGITIDLGFAHQTIDGINFAFVDVPGHERFVKNMLAGVGGIDLVVLVVAADESVMPQTREHFDICRLLRVPAGLVALTKSDLVDADTLELARLEVRELVAGSFLDGAPIVPVSARTGDGLDALSRRRSSRPAARCRAAPSHGAARLPIDRVFSMKGFGTVVTGTLVSGRIAVDDELAVAPGDRRREGARRAGARAAADRSRRRPAVGRQPGRRRSRRDRPRAGAARVRHLRRDAHRRRQRRGAAGRPAAQARRARAVSPGDRGDHRPGRDDRAGGTGSRPSRRSPPAGARSCGCGSKRRRCSARGDRYILRAYSPPQTIAGGLILDPQPPRTGIRSAGGARAAAAARVRSGGRQPRRGGAARGARHDRRGGAGRAAVDRADVTGRCRSDRALAAHAEALVGAAQAVRAGDVLVSAAVFTRLKDAIVQTLTAHHRAQPLSEGVPREELREQLAARAHPAVFDAALANLAAAGAISVRDRVALATHRLALSPEEERARGAIERAYRDGGLKPPDAASIAATTGVTAAVADRMLKLLQRQKVLVRVDVLLFHDESLKQLKAEVTALKASAGAGATARIDVATFKERFGVTRKFAIPLLEYLDRERVTRRMGETRVVL